MMQPVIILLHADCEASLLSLEVISGGAQIKLKRNYSKHNQCNYFQLFTLDSI